MTVNYPRICHESFTNHSRAIYVYSRYVVGTIRGIRKIRGRFKRAGKLNHLQVFT